MADQWVVLELSSKADGEDPDIVRKSIMSSIKDADVFIPAEVTQVGVDKVVHYLVEGYAFIRHTHPDMAYRRLENTRYITSVLTKTVKVVGRTQKKLALVSDADIEKMRRQMYAQTDQGIGVGDTIQVTSGPYKLITAVVIEEIPEDDMVQVHIVLRSKDTITTLPRSFLKLVSKAEKPEYLTKFDHIKMWFGSYIEALNLPEWDADIESIHNGYLEYWNLCRLVTLMGITKNPKSLDFTLDPKVLTQAYKRVQKLERLHTKLQTLVNDVRKIERSMK